MRVRHCLPQGVNALSDEGYHSLWIVGYCQAMEDLACHLEDGNAVLSEFLNERLVGLCHQIRCADHRVNVCAALKGAPEKSSPFNVIELLFVSVWAIVQSPDFLYAVVVSGADQAVVMTWFCFSLGLLHFENGSSPQ